jgi:CDP-diacylglycerol---serine O-phosphatidyltransferase
MMVSEVKYPSFKTLDLRARRTFPKTVLAIIFVAALVILRGSSCPSSCRSSSPLLLYGFVRPRISRKVRHEIEEEDEEDEGPHQ